MNGYEWHVFMRITILTRINPTLQHLELNHNLEAYKYHQNIFVISQLHNFNYYNIVSQYWGYWGY